MFNVFIAMRQDTAISPHSQHWGCHVLLVMTHSISQGIMTPALTHVAGTEGISQLLNLCQVFLLCHTWQWCCLAPHLAPVNNGAPSRASSLLGLTLACTLLLACWGSQGGSSHSWISYSSHHSLKQMSWFTCLLAPWEIWNSLLKSFSTASNLASIVVE